MRTQKPKPKDEMPRTATEAQKFGSDIVWVALSQVLTSLVGILVLPAFTKSYTTELYGVWTQANMTVTLLAIILALGLGTAVQRFLASEGDSKKRNQIFGAIFWTVFVFACLVLLVGIFRRQDISILLFAGHEFVSFVPLIFLWALARVLFSVSISYLVARGKIKKLAVVQISLCVIEISIMVILAMISCDLSSIVVCLVIIEAVFVAIVFGMIVKEIGFPKPNFRRAPYFLAFSLPLVPSVLLFWIIDSSDRYFIAHFVDLSQTGIYSVSYNLGSIVRFFYSPITFVLFPILSGFWDRQEIDRARSYLEYSIRFFLTLAIPASVGLYVLSQPLLGVLATTEYQAGGLLVLLISLAMVLEGVYLFNIYAAVVAKQTGLVPLAVGVAAAINIGMNLVLIPRVGIIGAAISTIVAYFVLAVVVIVWARRIVRYGVDLGFMAKVVLCSALMALCLGFVKVYNAVTILLAVFVGVVVYAAGMFLCRAFSKRDKELAMEILVGLVPIPWSGKTRVEGAESAEVESNDGGR